MLRAVVEHDGGDFDQVKRTTIGFGAVPSLIAGKVDAVVAFWNAEGVALRAARRAHARVPRRRLRRAALPRAGARDEARSTLGERRELVEAALGDRGRRGGGARRPRGDDRPDREGVGADEALVRAQLDAVAPALLPPMRLDRARARGLGATSTPASGSSRRRPDVDRAFPR